jgi:hypothetical protein
MPRGKAAVSSVAILEETHSAAAFQYIIEGERPTRALSLSLSLSWISCIHKIPIWQHARLLFVPLPSPGFITGTRPPPLWSHSCIITAIMMAHKYPIRVAHSAGPKKVRTQIAGECVCNLVLKVRVYLLYIVSNSRCKNGWSYIARLSGVCFLIKIFRPWINFRIDSAEPKRNQEAELVSSKFGL